MKEDILAEIYVKQIVRDHGVLQEDIGEENLSQVEEYISRKRWNQNSTVQLTEVGEELARNKIRDRISSVNKERVRREFQYAPFLIAIISEKNKLPTRQRDISPSMLTTSPNAWMEYYLEEEDVWDDVQGLMQYLQERRVCFKARHYVSGGKTKEEKYVWPVELSRVFRSPDLSKAKRKIREHRFLGKALKIIDNIDSEERMNERIYSTLSDYDLSEDKIRETVEELPDSLIQDASSFLESGPPFEFNQNRQSIVKGKIKKQLISEGKELLQDLDEREKERIENVIEKGEARSREFKKSLAYNSGQQKFEGDVERVCEEVSALANSGGGTLLVGVDDAGGVHGLNVDDQHDLDPYREELENQLKSKLPDSFVASFVSYDFVKLEDEFVCAINVGDSDEPLFYGKGKFFVRSGSSSRELLPQEALKYVKNNFN